MGWKLCFWVTRQVSGLRRRKRYFLAFGVVVEEWNWQSQATPMQFSILAPSSWTLWPDSPVVSIRRRYYEKVGLGNWSRWHDLAIPATTLSAMSFTTTSFTGKSQPPQPMNTRWWSGWLHWEVPSQLGMAMALLLRLRLAVTLEIYTKGQTRGLCSASWLSRPFMSTQGISTTFFSLSLMTRVFQMRSTCRLLVLRRSHLLNQVLPLMLTPLRSVWTDILTSCLSMNVWRGLVPQ